MKSIIGNEIAFKTFRFMKINNSEIEIPEFSKKDYYLKSDGNVKILKEFDEIDYGISKEALLLNEEYLNLYKVFETKEDEEKTVETFYLKTDEKNDQLFDRHDIIAGKNSKLKVVLDYYSEGQNEKFRNSVIRILAHENSEVDVFIIQRENEFSKSLESIGVYVKDGAKVNVGQFELGSGNLYTNYKCELIGKNANSFVDSIYFGDGNEKLDLSYDMIHRGSNTTSNLLINGVLTDSAKKKLKTNLQFIEGSDHAVGSEGENVIMLSENARSISVPLMLAHEDDIEGNHACSVGRLDADIIFYLMSRGINIEDAQGLIIESKFAGAIDKLNDEDLREEVWQRVREIIKGRKNAN